MPRRNSRGGHNAAENLISALRCLYQRAVDDGLMEEKDNPARKVAKGRRLPSTRRAVRAACRAAGVSSSGYCEWKDKEVAGPDTAGIADHRRRHIVSMVWRG